MKSCEYCLKNFTNDKKFELHSCKEKERAEYVKTIEGTKAYNIFKEWIRLRHYSNDNINTFLNSKYFTSFKRFVEFIRKKDIVSVDIYMEFVVNKGLSPNTWHDDLVFDAFIKYLDNEKPMNSVIIGLQTLNKYATKFNCKIDRVLYKLYPNEYINLLQKRQLTPWLLLNTKGFLDYLSITKFTKEQIIIINSLIPDDIWIDKLNNNPIIVDKILVYTKQLNL